ncbi:Hypothetical protein, putative [Bodo saltans]|uniref:Uncharacterized protein n=1 Tax=Bodo saltans TaxID=75058 RepID=A0A0S4KM56_BODSA|nr:Hypothetical protein, putative [Bodo saltans]|eukprot:CUI14677.1 Hypothetical protein, putative [Bodo saltans]
MKVVSHICVSAVATPNILHLTSSFFPSPVLSLPHVPPSHILRRFLLRGQRSERYVELKYKVAL